MIHEDAVFESPVVHVAQRRKAITIKYLTAAVARHKLEEGELTMLSRILLGVLGLIQVVNGLLMIGDTDSWYWAIPGVSQTGPMNHHFIIDIGLAFIVSGTSMTIGLRAGRAATTCALIGATWPALHALFHILEWFVDGFPSELSVAVADAQGVVFIGFLGFSLALRRARKEGAI
jgi:hypothetical protein